MRKIYLVIIFLFSNLHNTQVQSTVNLPTSPEVAMFKRFGDIPVSFYTGVVGTEIPIYSFNQYGFNIPISLNYQASGIKLDDQATWVGLGWNLMPEGIIYQDVRGTADQSDGSYTSPSAYASFYDRLENYPGGTGRFKVVKQRGFSDYNWCLSVGNQPISCFPPTSPIGSDPDVVVNDLVYRNYGEVDTFRFNFFGHSGSFFINLQTRQIVLIDKSENIQFQVGDGSILAIDDKGIKYTFSQREIFTNYNSISLSPEYSSRSYKISQIELPTKQKIFFDYEDGNYNFYSFNQSRNIYKSGYNLKSPMCSGKINYQYTPPQAVMNTSIVKILKRIRTDELIAEFNLESRDDINLLPNNNLKRLKSVDIFNARNNKKIKSAEFDYTYYPFLEDLPTNVFPPNFLSTNQKNALGKRLKLDKVSIYSFDNLDNKIDISEDYSFEYNLSTTLPSKVSFAKDLWGYYNGHISNELLPNLKFFFQASGTTFSNYESNNRYANTNYTEAYMLKRIQYPTKGYTDFQYESNSFNNQFIPSHNQVLDYTIIKHLNNTGIGGYQSVNNDTLSIKINEPKIIKFLNSFSGGFDGGPFGPQSKRYDFYQLIAAGASIQFLKVKTNQFGVEHNEVLKQWNLADVVSASTFNQNYSYQWEDSYNIDSIDPDPTTKYRVKLNINNNMYHPADLYHSAGVFSMVTYIETPVIDSNFESLGHGVRIKDIKNYSNLNVLSDHKQYEYYDGKILNKINPTTLKDYYCFDCDAACSDLVSYNEFFLISDQVSSSEYDAVGYGKVVEKIIDGNSSKGNTEYHYHNLENTTANFFPVIKRQTNGLLHSKVVKNWNNEILHSDNYYYKNLLSFNQFYSVRTEKKFLLSGKDPMLASTGGYDGISKYIYYVTPMMSESHKIDSVVSKQYFGSHEIVTKKTFNYSSQGNVIKENMYHENESKQISTDIKYAYEKGNQLMIDKNMIGIPLETTTTKTTGTVSKVISKVETLYPTALPTAQTGNLVLPLSVNTYDLQNLGALTTDITYDRYDSKGNVLQYTTKDGIVTSIVWGYHSTQPIAKIVGATYAQVENFASAIIASSDIDASAGRNNDETGFLNDLRSFGNSLQNYQVTTYTHDPLIGVRSITPPSGIREVYLYDLTNRLMEIRENNQSGRLIKEFKYNYKN